MCFNDSSVYPVNSLPLINTGKGLLYQATMDSVDPNALELKSKGETEGRLKMWEKEAVYWRKNKESKMIKNSFLPFI